MEDKNKNVIAVGDYIWYRGIVHEIIINNFNQKTVLDSPYGQVNMSDTDKSELELATSQDWEDQSQAINIAE